MAKPPGSGVAVTIPEPVFLNSGCDIAVESYPFSCGRSARNRTGKKNRRWRQPVRQTDWRRLKAPCMRPAAGRSGN